MDNLLTWDGATLIVRMMAGDDFDFVDIINYELHKHTFGDMMILPFPCLIQLSCDKDGFLEVKGIDHRVEVESVSQRSMIKDSKNLFFPRDLIHL